MTGKTQKRNLLIISLHADPSMPPGVGEWGGTHTYMRELLTELCNTNYNVILITRKVYSEEKDIEIISSSCRILRLTIGKFGIFDKKELYDLHEETVRQALEKLQAINFIPDVMHSVYWNSGHLAMTLSALWHIPYVHSVISNGRGRNEHGAAGTAKHRIETEQLVFTNASFILCVAESEKKEICQYYNISPDKIAVAGQYVHPAFIYAAHDIWGNPRKSGINYEIESLYFTDYRSSHSVDCNWWNKQVFTYTGRLSLDKGLNYIVQAWLLLLDKYDESCPPLWVIGGNATDIESIRPQLGISLDRLDSLEKRRRLVWWGYLDENGISAIYTRTLVLLTHSKYEPGGRVAIEAMCEGLPVLATPNGFALDTIRDWVNGFLIAYKDVQALSIRMEHFIKQPYLSNCMGYQAMNIGRSILDDWAFKKTHLAVYNAALEHQPTYTKPSHTLPPSDYPCRKLHIYPYNMTLIDNSDILQFMEDNGIQNVLSVHQLEMPDASSFIWETVTKEKSYYIKVPYDRMNLIPLWADIDEHPLVITGLKRYHAEIGATTFSEIPIIEGKDSTHHAIIRIKYENVTIPKLKQLEFAINKIEKFYKSNTVDWQDPMNQLNKVIEQKDNYQKIDALYKRISITSFPWQYYFMDYSLRVELNRWHQYYELLSLHQQKSISALACCAYEKSLEISAGESKLMPVVNHGGFDYKNLVFTPEVVLLDNEKLHIGWPGIDYADLLITFVRKHYQAETLELWKNILSFIPPTFISQKILVGWLLLSAYKEAISEAACLKPISSVLSERTDILLQLL